MLPHDIPFHGDVFCQCQKWAIPWPGGGTALSRALGKLVCMNRNLEGGAAMIIADSKGA
jgi:hypothetical protein